mgnify:CR=1 FL=1
MDRTQPDPPDRNPVSAILDRALGEKQWTITDLHKELVRMGYDIAYSTVRYWVSGNTGPGMALKCVKPLCVALSIDPVLLIDAAAIQPKKT